MPSLEDLATSLRAMQFYAHAAHNCASGPNFYQDHSVFSELYSAYEDAYDSVVERIIGTDAVPDFKAITKDAAQRFGSSGFNPGDENSKWFQKLLKSEEDMRGLIDLIQEKESNGTQNLLQDLSDASEQRSYKIGQRIA